MPITDKIAAAKKISELLNGIITTGDFRLRYKIIVDPPAADHDPTSPSSWWNSPAPTARWCWSAAANCCAPSSMSLWRCCASPRTSTTRSSSIARTSAPPASRSCACRPSCCRARAPHRHALRLRAHVVARAPISCISRCAISRPAHRERRRGAATLRRGLSQGLQRQAARTRAIAAAQIAFTIVDIEAEQSAVLSSERRRIASAPVATTAAANGWNLLQPIEYLLRLSPCLRASVVNNLVISSMHLDDTIVAIATPPGRGGIGVVRLSGPEARASRVPCCGWRSRRSCSPIAHTLAS